MRKIDALLAEYSESHQNETNKLVHWLAVPAIVWSVLALLYALPFPGWTPRTNLAAFFIIGAMIYYCFLSWSLAFAMFVFSFISYKLIQGYSFPLPLWQFALGVFVVAWIAQFWGHKIEGKKPSFFKDIQFLLIGPVWLASFLFKKAGIRY
jgi:uncharacterized membrane protein YGL010W